jgi:deoxyribose-phosphate aldolase
MASLSAESLPSPETLASMIHNTLVNPEASWKELQEFVLKSADCGFWAVVVQGRWAREVKELVKGSDVRMSVGVGFPMGEGSMESKKAEIEQALAAGADLFDFVPNMSYLKSGMYDRFGMEMAEIVKAAEGRPVSAALEYPLLNLDEKVRAAMLAQEAGVMIVGNSSIWGRAEPAMVGDIMLLRSITSSRTKVKASGGVHDLDAALRLIGAGADFVGTGSGVSIIDELRRRTAGR